MTTADTGNKVTVHYVGTFDNGEIFDSSRSRGEPITFQLGTNQVVPGFENAITGMSVGESKTVTLAPEEGYGPIMEDLHTTVPTTAFPEDSELTIGTSVHGTSSDGQEMSAIITGVESDNVTLDFNHPLAGKDLTFKIELVDLEE
jgi:peptidylprolyl isomerase